MLIQQLGFVDTWALSASMYRKQALFPKPADGLRSLRVREPREDAVWMHPDIRKGGNWGSLRTKLSEATRMLNQGFPSLVMGAVDVEMLDAGAWVPWHRGEDEIAIHIGIVSNPGNTLYAGMQSWLLAQGQVVLYAPGKMVLRSAVNFGEQPRINLILRLAQRVVVEDQEAA